MPTGVGFVANLKGGGFDEDRVPWSAPNQSSALRSYVSGPSRFNNNEPAMPLTRSSPSINRTGATIPPETTMPA
jgi:hypothetical protein